MSQLSYQILKHRQIVYTKVYAGLCLILLLLTGVFSYFKWQTYQDVRDFTSSNKDFIVTLGKEASSEKAEYESHKTAFADLNKEVEDKLNTIFPTSGSYTALTRQIDSYEEELSSKNNPFEISNLSYQEVVSTDKYSMLPLQMSIRSSADNFTKFLHLIENSGALNGQVRLMDLSSITLNFESLGVEVGQPEIINFNVQVNAYFQKI